MNDPFGSMIPLFQISPSQELALAPGAAQEDSQEMPSLGVVPTVIRMVSPPESPDANEGTLSQENFETPPEEALPAASSEERWFGCNGDSVVLGAGCAEDEKMADLDGDPDLGFSETGMAPEPVADSESGGALAEDENEKTVDLLREADLGFSETGKSQKRVADSESGGAHLGRKLVKVEISESELTQFMEWKRKIAFRKWLLEDQRQKRSKLGSPRPGAGPGVPIVEERSIDNMNSTMGYLKSTNSIPALESPESLQVNQKLIKSKDCTLVLSLDSEVNSLVSDAGMVKNGMESNECTQAVKLVSGGKDLVEDVEMFENGLGSNDCTEVLNLGCVDKDLVADSVGLDLKDCTEVVMLDSGHEDPAADVVMAKKGVESNDCTEVVGLDSGGKVPLSDQCIAKNGLGSTEELVMDSDGGDNLVCNEAFAKNGLGSTEELVMDSDGGDNLVCNEAFAKINLASTESTEVAEGEGLASGASVAKKGPTLKDRAEKGIANDPNAEKLQITGEGMGFDSRQRPQGARVLPMSMNVAKEEGDSTNKPVMELLLSALSKLPKTQPDPRFENLSLVEIAKLRGVTFPRPRWWGDEE